MRTTTIVTFAIYALIFLVIGAAVYFFAFWRPNGNRVEQLNRDIYTARSQLATAAHRDEMYPELRYDIDRLGRELYQVQRDGGYVSRDWQYQHLRFLPETFNELDIRERIYRVATYYSHNLNVNFQYSQPLGVMNYNYNSPYDLPQGIWVTPIDISFTASYDGIMAILNGFAHEEIDNRIVDYTLHRNGDQWNVVLRMDVLTQTPQPYRYNREYNFEPQG